MKHDVYHSPKIIEQEEWLIYQGERNIQLKDIEKVPHLKSAWSEMEEYTGEKNKRMLLIGADYPVAVQAAMTGKSLFEDRKENVPEQRLEINSDLARIQRELWEASPKRRNQDVFFESTGKEASESKKEKDLEQKMVIYRIKEEEREDGKGTKVEVRGPHAVPNNMPKFIYIESGIKEGEELISILIDLIKDAEMVFLYFNSISENLLDRLWFEYEFHVIRLEEPKTEHYIKLLVAVLEQEGEELAEDVDKERMIYELKEYRGERFSDSDIEVMAKRAIRNAEKRNHEKICLEDFHLERLSEHDKKTPEEEMNAIIGCRDVKMKIDRMAKLRKFERQRDDSGNREHKNMIFIGNPGVGKTTMARIYSRKLARYGLTNGKFISVAKSDLVGKYCGWTAAKVKEIFTDYKGGMIFIDEADSFLMRDDFTKEAIKEIVRYMELQPQTIVIFAIYSDCLEDFLNLDPGLKSRIAAKIVFPDYSDDELYEILCGMAGGQGYCFEDSCKEDVIAYIRRMKKNAGKSFGNAREMRNLFLKTKEILAVDTLDHNRDPKEIHEIQEWIVKKAVKELEGTVEEKQIARIGFYSEVV